MNQKGEKEGTINLKKEVFDVGFDKEQVTRYVRVYLANQRQGTAVTQTRGEVTGSTRKIYRQKGTGRARAGSIRSPLWRHGGVVSSRSRSRREARARLRGNDGKICASTSHLLSERHKRRAASADYSERQVPPIDCDNHRCKCAAHAVQSSTSRSPTCANARSLVTSTAPALRA